MKAAACIAVAALLVLVVAGPAGAYKCGPDIITVGAAQDDVRRSCGEPSAVNQWHEERFMQGSGRVELPAGGRPAMAVPYKTIRHVDVQEWTYNNGPNQLKRILRFENGRLVDIHTGGYGD